MLSLTYQRDFVASIRYGSVVGSFGNTAPPKMPPCLGLQQNFFGTQFYCSNLLPLGYRSW